MQTCDIRQKIPPRQWRDIQATTVLVLFAQHAAMQNRIVDVISSLYDGNCMALAAKEFKTHVALWHIQQSRGAAAAGAKTADEIHILAMISGQSTWRVRWTWNLAGKQRSRFVGCRLPKFGGGGLFFRPNRLQLLLLRNDAKGKRRRRRRHKLLQKILHSRAKSIRNTRQIILFNKFYPSHFFTIWPLQTRKKSRDRENWTVICLSIVLKMTRPLIVWCKCVLRMWRDVNGAFWIAVAQPRWQIIVHGNLL